MRASRITALLATIMTFALSSPALGQARDPRFQLGAGAGVATVNANLTGPAIDVRAGWRVGNRISVGALFGFYGMNDEAPREGDVVPNGIDVMFGRVPNVAQVRTWNGFVQWTASSGVFIRPGGGFGWHRFAFYMPFPQNTATPQSYLPGESSEMGLIFTLAAGKEFRRSSRVGVAIEGFLVMSSGEDSSSQRTIVGVNVVPLLRW
jgi:hypothetical protein